MAKKKTETSFSIDSSAQWIWELAPGVEDHVSEQIKPAATFSWQLETRTHVDHTVVPLLHVQFEHGDG